MSDQHIGVKVSSQSQYFYVNVYPNVLSYNFQEKAKQTAKSEKTNESSKTELSTDEKKSSHTADKPAAAAVTSQYSLPGENMFNFDTFMDTIQMTGLNVS